MAESKESRVWVRLKPYNEREGQVLQRFSIYGMRFEEKRGWYIVPTEIELANGRVVDLAAKLRSIRNDNDNPRSPLAFDVMSEEEAKNLDETQRREAEERKAALDANRVVPAPTLGVDHEDQEPIHRRGRGRARKSPGAGV